MFRLFVDCSYFSFVKYDNPVYNMSSSIPWTPVTIPNGRQHLSINTPPVMKPYFHADDVYFWNDVIPTLQRALSTSAPVQTTTTTTPSTQRTSSTRAPVQTTTTPSTPRTPSTSAKPTKPELSTNMPSTQRVLSTSASVKATTTAASTLRFPGYLGSFCQVFVLLMVGRFLTM